MIASKRVFLIAAHAVIRNGAVVRILFTKISICFAQSLRRLCLPFSIERRCYNLADRLRDKSDISSLRNRKGNAMV